MNCTCFKDTEDRLKTRVTESDMSPPKGGTVKDVSCSAMALYFTSGKFGLNIPFTVTWEGSKKRETTVYVKASHCPFCGAAATCPAS